MIAHFDYVIWNTMTCVRIQDGLPSALYPKTEASREALNVFPAGFLSLIEYEIVKPRAPFLWSLQCINTKLRMSGTFDSPKVHVEVPGTACDILETSGHLDAIVIERQPYLTRVDVAVDFKCDIAPDEVSKTCGNGNFQNRVTFKSKDGHTEYIGSMTSDRYARVYRYHPPTPRHEYLRIEHVFRRNHAKALALAFGVGGWDAILSSIGDVWKWGHPIWTENINTTQGDAKKIGWQRERKVSKTLLWLERQVAPSIVRLIRAGELDDFDDWLKLNVYDKINSS